MIDLEAITAMQQVARRWARQRASNARFASDDSSDNGTLGGLVRALFEQGWLPATVNEWGAPAALILARLGEALATQSAAGYVTILTHCLGLHLSGTGGSLSSLTEPRLIACSPYIDYSRVVPSVGAEHRDNGWVLNGLCPWIVNFAPADRLLVVAQDPSHRVMLFSLKLRAEGCLGGSCLPLFGLCGSCVQHARLSSVAASEQDVVAYDTAALDNLAEGYRIARWGMTGLLAGIVGDIADAATSYAENRAQGGRRIIEHSAVRQLVDASRTAHVQLSHLIAQLHDAPQANCPMVMVRQLALHATDHALQVFGGSGYMCPGLPERCWRDVRQAVTLCSAPCVVPISCDRGGGNS